MQHFDIRNASANEKANKKPAQTAEQMLNIAYLGGNKHVYFCLCVAVFWSASSGYLYIGHSDIWNFKFFKINS